MNIIYFTVPIVSFQGNSMLSRHGEQFLTILNLKEFIAKDINDFINICEKQSRDLNNLREIKINLREKLLNSSIGNGLIFSKQFEELLEQIIQNNKQ